METAASSRERRAPSTPAPAAPPAATWTCNSEPFPAPDFRTPPGATAFARCVEPAVALLWSSDVAAALGIRAQTRSAARGRAHSVAAWDPIAIAVDAAKGAWQPELHARRRWLERHA